MANIGLDHFIDRFDGSKYQRWFIHMEKKKFIEKNNGTMLMVLQLNLLILQIRLFGTLKM
jgi:hypothetical protein